MRSSTRQHRPLRGEDELRIGPSVPGVALRALGVLIAVGAALLLAPPFGWVVVVAVLALIGVLPNAQVVTWLVAAVLTALLIVQGPGEGRAAVVVAAVHALHVLGSLSFVVPVAARIALRALVPTAARFVAVQALTQAVLAGILLLPPGGAAPAVALAGAAAVLVLAIRGVRMLHGRRGSAFPRLPARSPSADAQPGVGGRS